MVQDPLEALGQRALELVREQYEHIAEMQGVDLARINRRYPRAMQYRSMRQLLREWQSNAGAVSTFAVNLGLITPEEAQRVILDFYAAHPEMREEEQEQEA